MPLPASLCRWVLPSGSVHARVGVTVMPAVYTIRVDRCALLAEGLQVGGTGVSDLKKWSERAESGEKRRIPPVYEPPSVLPVVYAQKRPPK